MNTFIIHIFLSSVAANLPVYDAAALPQRFDIYGRGRHVINDADDVVGSVSVANSIKRQAAIWRKGGLILLDPPPPANGCDYDSSVAIAINNSGTVIGFASVSAGGCQDVPTMWKEDKATILAGVEGYVSDINDNDVIVGGGASNQLGWVYDHGQIERLQPFEQPGQTAPTSINNLGQVAGQTFLTSGGHFYAAVWDHGNLTVWPSTSSIAEAINDNGQTVVTHLGVRSKVDLSVWNWQTNTFTKIDLEAVLGANATGQVRDINKRGEVVGLMAADGGKARAFYWNGGIVRSLNALTKGADTDPYADNLAISINDNGEAAGIGYAYDRYGTAYDKAEIWKPIGELWQ